MPTKYSVGKSALDIVGRETVKEWIHQEVRKPVALCSIAATRNATGRQIVLMKSDGDPSGHSA